mgnify:CR=1
MDSHELSKPCPKCGAEMTKGFMKDQSYVTMWQQRWVSKLFGKETKVDSFACSSCGYLESYLQK